MSLMLTRQRNSLVAFTVFITLCTYQTTIKNSMKRIWLWLGIVAIALSACDKKNELLLDGIPDSVKQHITDNCACDPQIGLFRWNERLLYVHWFIGPACNTITSYYDKKGNPVELTSNEQNAFWEEKELVEMIWVCGE